MDRASRFPPECLLPLPGKTRKRRAEKDRLPRFSQRGSVQASRPHLFAPVGLVAVDVDDPSCPPKFAAWHWAADMAVYMGVVIALGLELTVACLNATSSSHATKLHNGVNSRCITRQ